MENSRLTYLELMGIQAYVRRDRVQETAPDYECATPLADSGSEKTPEVLTTEPAFVPGWDELRQQVVACQACDLCKTRTQTVFGVGDRNADLMIIGEAPGADEDRQGEPFVGRAGQLLNNMLKAIGLDRQQVFIANILKCRPPGNRNPSSEEAAACEKFLLRQIALVNPQVILSLGKVSAQNLLKSDASVARLRNGHQLFGEQQWPLKVTYHPAYLLRRPSEKAKAWEDLQQLKRLLDT